jgi:AcrR family transcriptional regulator
MADRKTGGKPATKRQKQILNAAMEVFVQKGYAAATMPEIAEMAGVAAGTIYIYYPSKRDLFIAVIQNVIFDTPLLNLIDKISADQFPVIFKHIMQNRLSLSQGSNMPRLLSFMGEIQRDPELKVMYLEQLIQPILSRMEAFYRSQIAADRIRQLDPPVVVRAIGGMIIGLVMLESLEGEASPLNGLPQEKVSDDLLKLVLYGLAGENRPTGANQEGTG